MRIGEREQREDGECPPAKLANPPSDTNPVVVFIVRLLASATVTDDGIAFTNRTSARKDAIAIASPIAFDLVWLGRKWDNNNRWVVGTLFPASTRQNLSRKRSPSS